MQLASIAISICIPGPLSLARTVRSHVVEVFRVYVGNEEALARLGLGVHELMDNCIRHAKDGSSILEAQLEKTEQGGLFRVTTYNPCRAGDQERAVAVIRATAESREKEEFYDRIIRESVSQPGSGLGLPRVCVEAELELDCSSDDERLKIWATGLVPLRKGE